MRGTEDCRAMTCPVCGSRSVDWRSGVHFDHEVRCADCSEHWEPGCEDDLLVRVRRRKAMLDEQRARTIARALEHLEFSGAMESER